MFNRTTSKHVSSRIRVLIADDPEHCERVRFLLDEFALNISEEFNGSRAIDRALNEVFDAILLADNLPILTGLDAAKMLRTQKISTPIVMMTNSELTKDLQHYVEAGCTATITRPVVVEQLFKTLDSVLATNLWTTVDDSLTGSGGNFAQRRNISHIEQGVRATKRACEFRDATRVTLLVEKLRGEIDVCGFSELNDSAEKLEVRVRALVEVNSASPRSYGAASSQPDSSTPVSSTLDGAERSEQASYEQILATLTELHAMVAELQNDGASGGLPSTAAQTHSASSTN
jgi:CheY-like chemotaxis protein